MHDREDAGLPVVLPFQFTAVGEQARHARIPPRPPRQLSIQSRQSHARRLHRRLVGRDHLAQRRRQAGLRQVGPPASGQQGARPQFDPLLPGFQDWGTWWQGEIAGEYFLANSNLVSHQVRLHVTPKESVGAGLIGYLFRLDELTGAPRVTSKDLAFELDAYQDGVNADRWAGDYSRTKREVDKTRRFKVRLAEGGGWAARLRPRN